jgi:hypothetical protein
VIDVVFDVDIANIQRRIGRGRWADRKSRARGNSRGGDDGKGGRRIGAEEVLAVAMERSEWSSRSRS